MAEAIVQIGRFRGFQHVALTVAPPATEGEIADVEHQLGATLPASFRSALLDVAAAFELRWQLPDGLEAPFQSVSSGGVGWSLPHLVHFEKQRLDSVREVFPNPSAPYDRIWHDKLAVFPVVTGDMIALDLTCEPAPLVYLSHDDSGGHGHLLGHDFADAITRWLRLGGVGNEDWQWRPFVDSPTSGLQPDSPNGLRWRDWLGLPRL